MQNFYIRSTTALLLMAAMLPMTGCLELNGILSLNRDSSGEIDIEYSVPEQTVQQLRAMLKLRDNLLAASEQEADKHDQYLVYVMKTFLDPSDASVKKFFSALNTNGISLNSMRIRSREGSRQVLLSASFSALEQLAASEPFSLFGFSLHPAQDGVYRMVRSGNPQAAKPELDPDNPAFIASVIPFLNGFRTELRVIVPGTIIDADTPAFHGNTATWTYDFDREPLAIHRLVSRGMEVKFSAPEIALPHVSQPAPTSL